MAGQVPASLQRQQLVMGPQGVQGHILAFLSTVRRTLLGHVYAVLPTENCKCACGIALPVSVALTLVLSWY